MRHTRTQKTGGSERSRFRSRLTYANVMATAAFFLALSTGGAYATHLVVNSSDVVNESLTGTDVKGNAGTSSTAAVNGSLTGADIAGQAANPAVNQPAIDGSLTTYDIKNATVGAVDLASNSVSSTKVADNSLTGADVNESTLSGVKISGLGTYSDRTAKDSTSRKVAEVLCPSGQQLLGTGYTLDGVIGGTQPNETANVVVTHVLPRGTSVLIQAAETVPTDGAWELIGLAICANAE